MSTSSQATALRHAVCRAARMTSEEPAREVVVLGGAYTDYVAIGARLPARGEDVQGDVFHEFPGGKGFNQALAAARLGARVAFVLPEHAAPN